MIKNSTICISKISNCYEYGISILAYTRKEMRTKNPQKMLYNALNNSIPEQYYAIDLYDEDECEEDYIDCYLAEYCEQYNIDLMSAKIVYNY